MDLTELKKNLPEAVESQILTQFKELNERRRALEFEFREETSKLEKKYHALNKPLYEQRKELIKSLPNFWRTVLLNHPVLENIISEDDKKALDFLNNIELNYDSETPSFKLTFEFSENPFFENKSLVKEFTIVNPKDPQYSDFIFECSQGTKIDWKAGNNICFQKSVKTQRNKKTGNIRKQEVEVPKPSFFHFFGDVKYILSDETEEDASQFEDNIEAEMELAEIFKSTLIPDAQMWYLNENDADEEGEDFEYSESDDGSIDSESGDEPRMDSHNLQNKEQCRQQ